MKEKFTICDVIAAFLSGKKRGEQLSHIYENVEETYEKAGKHVPERPTIRAAIYRAPEKYDFKKIAKGVYAIKGEHTMSLLFNGDSRTMPEIDDGAVDCIITDHPWSDPKAHKSGNQKCFAEYDTFVYTQEDFDEKARVLKDGSFLVEFLPVESATNWKYISTIKEMAEKTGFQYYAQTIWRKAPEGAINTGRTTKGVEQMLLFTKGKPRRLSPKGKPYLTKNMLSWEIDIPAAKPKDKNHQAEKPLALYEYLVDNLTNEYEVCLDQFGGACNLIAACQNLKRFGIVYELSKEFVEKAVKRFGMTKLLDADDESYQVSDIPMETNTSPTEHYVISLIPKESTDFQVDFINKVIEQMPEIIDDDEKARFENVKDDTYTYATLIDEIFKNVNKRGYAGYSRPTFDIDILAYNKLMSMYADIDKIFKEKYPDEYTRPANENFKIEAQAFAEYGVVKQGISSLKELPALVDRYLSYLQGIGSYNIPRTRRLITQFVGTI